jgi:hypothetical protein
VWSDETKINCLGSDGRKWVWKKKGKFGGGSLMMWSCVFWEECGYACQIENIYVAIWEENLKDSLEYYGKERGDFTFQQNNDSKHKSKKAQTWFKDNNIDLLQLCDS